MFHGVQRWYTGQVLLPPDRNQVRELSTSHNLIHKVTEDHTLSCISSDSRARLQPLYGLLSSLSLPPTLTPFTPSLVVSPLCAISVFHIWLNYCLAVSLLAAVPICATKTRDLHYTHSGRLPKDLTLVSAGCVNYSSNLMSLVMQIKVTSEFPDVLVSMDVSTFGKQGERSNCNVSWFCRTKTHPSNSLVSNSQWEKAGLNLEEPLSKCCLSPVFTSHKRRSLIYSVKKAKHLNLLRAGPFLYLSPASQQCSRGVAGSELASEKQRSVEGGEHKICMLEETRWT